MLNPSLVHAASDNGQRTANQKNTACPYHRMMNLTRKLQLNAKIYHAKASLWLKIKVLKKVSLTILMGSLLYLCLATESFFSNFQAFTSILFWLFFIPSAIISFCFLHQNTHPAIRFAAKLFQYGLKNYYQAFFETFDATKDYAYYRTFIFWGTKKLVIRDEHIVASVLNQPNTFKRVSIGSTEYLPFNNKSVLGAGTGENWLKYRKTFASYFSKDYVNDIPKIKVITEKAIEQWKEKGEINLLEELLKLIVEIRGEVFFQKSFGCLEQDFNSKNLAYVVHQILQAPTFILQGNPDGMVKKFHEEVITAIESADKPGSLGNICKTKFENGEFTSEEAIQNASMFILAQAPTMILFWNILRTAQNGKGKELAANNSNLLQHLKEELRIHPAVPSIFSRIAQATTTIGNLTIERGTEVVLSPLFIQQNPNQWANPAEFNPSNWEIEKEEALELLNTKTDKKDQNGRPESSSACPFAGATSKLRNLPFGHGRHRCQGRKYAATEIFTISQIIFQKLDLSLISKSDLLNLPIAAQTQMHVYNCPKEDVRINVK